MEISHSCTSGFIVVAVNKQRIQSQTEKEFQTMTNDLWTPDNHGHMCLLIIIFQNYFLFIGIITSTVLESFSTRFYLCSFSNKSFSEVEH